MGTNDNDFAGMPLPAKHFHLSLSRLIQLTDIRIRPVLGANSESNRTRHALSLQASGGGHFQALRIALQMIQNTIICAPYRLRDPLSKMTRMQLIRTLAARRLYGPVAY